MAWDENHGSDEEAGDRRLAVVAESQAGVASLDQLRSIDLTQRTAEYRVGQARLHRVHRGVYAVGHRAIGRAGELHAALLACGKGTIISHGTAGALWGLRDRWPVLIDITGHCQAGRKIAGIRCRRCRYPSEEEVTAHQGVACTTPARTLIDLAGMLGAVSLRRAVERAAVLKLLDLIALDEALLNATRRRGVSTLRAIIDDWRVQVGSAQDLRSDFEALVLQKLLTSGVPRPVCNKTLELEGERLMVDFLWEEQRVVLETDGAQTHGTPVAFQRDRRRDQILVAAGYRVARATWDQMRDEPEAVIRRIARALARPAPSS